VICLKKRTGFPAAIEQKINSLNLFATSTIGLLGPNESLSIMAMPGGNETVFLDGTRDKDFNVQINAKSRSQMNCFNALTTIYQTLENLDDLPSENGSYEFQRIITTSPPSILMQDEQGFFVYVLSIQAKITVYKGVEV
jgi:hypothetical protein